MPPTTPEKLRCIPYFALLSKEQVPSRQEFFHQLSKTSQNIVDFIVADRTGIKLKELGTHYQLSDDQIETLAYLIRQIALGELFAGDMTSQMVERLQIPSETAQAIRTSIVNELFKPAIEDIKKIQREKFPDRVRQNSPRTTPQAPTVGAGNTVDLRNQK